MREGAPVDPNLSLADMLPPDRADESRILQSAFALVGAVARRTPDGRAEITVTLDAAGWAALEAERRRYLRPHASYVYAPHPEGAGAARLIRGADAVAALGAELDATRRRIDRAVADLTAELHRLGIEARWNGEHVTLHTRGTAPAAGDLVLTAPVWTATLKGTVPVAAPDPDDVVVFPDGPPPTGPVTGVVVGVDQARGVITIGGPADRPLPTFGGGGGG